jgi:hypothetical protein
MYCGYLVGLVLVLLEMMEKVYLMIFGLTTHLMAYGYGREVHKVWISLPSMISQQIQVLVNAPTRGR